MTASLGALLAWSAGVAGATAILPGVPLAGAIFTIAALVAATLALVVRPAAIGVAMTAALLGAARSELPAGDATAAARAPTLAGLQAVVRGTVEDDPRPLADGYQLLISPQAIQSALGPRSPAGNVLILVRGDGAPGVGDEVEATGRLDLPRDQPTFDVRVYLAQRGAFLEMRSARVQVVQQAGGPRALPGWVRDRYREAVSSVLPPPHAEVLTAVVLGVRAGIPARLQHDLIVTGLVHLLVLSGLKVAVFARLVVGALTPLLGRQATLPTLALIALYALAGGATPAALRACAMGALALVARHLGRPTHVWTALAATAAAMLAWRPELTLDVGFQLSFAGTAAIILLTPTVERRLQWVPDWIREPFAVTCAAQVGTLPLMATNFGLISPIAPLANAAVLPLLPAMVAGGLLIAPLSALPALGQVIALPLTGLVAYLEQVASLLARLPAAAVNLPALSGATGAAYYAALAGAVGALRTSGRVRMATIAVGILAPGAIGTAELVAWAHPAPSAVVLAVGNGQAVLLTGPGGYVLIDGGPSPSKLKGELGARLPPWDRNLAALVITGAGIGHVGGLASLDLPAANVLIPAGSLPGSAWRNAALTEEALGGRLITAIAGQRLHVAGLTLEVLSPEPASPDPGQIALRASSPRGGSFCDFADLSPDEQVAAAARLTEQCQSLLLPQGGRTALTPELAAAARPQRLVASDVAGTRLARDLPATVVRTSQEGDVSLPL
jgi:ComEC/Rec2-related protein